MTRMRSRQTMSGLSLIELMIALTIGLIIMLGVVQVFAASRTAYQLSEGLARVQENSRFAMDSLQRELRMAGHFGCVNDQAHDPQGTLATTFAAGGHPALDFARSIQGYEATNTKPGDAVTLAATPSTGGDKYSPALPSEFAAAIKNRVDGSDIVALRYLVPTGVPVTAVAGTVAQPVFSFDPKRLAVLDSGVTDAGLFGVADCISATVFQARAIDAKAGTVTVGTAPNNDVAIARNYQPGQAVLYRAETSILYVGYDATTKQSSLYRLRFTAKPGAALVAGPAEALVEGVENMQLLYGQDHGLSTVSPTGYIDRQGTATDVQASIVPASRGWQRVGTVQLGLVVSSPDPAASVQASSSTPLTALGVTYTAPSDGRMRAAYQSTIALRNRLYGN